MVDNLHQVRKRRTFIVRTCEDCPKTWGQQNRASQVRGTHTLLVFLQARPACDDQAFRVDRLPPTNIRRRCPRYGKESNITQMRDLASASVSPWNLKNDISCWATPTPADPAPKKRMRWSAIGFPAASEARRAAFKKPDRTTAPVPCIYG